MHVLLPEFGSIHRFQSIVTLCLQMISKIMFISAHKAVKSKTTQVLRFRGSRTGIPNGGGMSSTFLSDSSHRGPTEAFSYKDNIIIAAEKHEKIQNYTKLFQKNHTKYASNKGENITDPNSGVL